MAYLGTHIPVNLTRATFQGPFTSIPVNLVGALAPEPCAGQWKPVPASQINFDLNIGWSPRDHDAVNFSFSCSVDCEQAWVDRAGWRVPLSFTKNWTDLEGNLVPLSFDCDDSGGPAGNTFFPGSFNFASGESATFDLQTSWVLRAQEGGYTDVTLYVPDRDFSAGFYTGETGSASLVNDIRIAPSVHEGAYLNVDITDNPAAVLEPLFYTGESGETSLSTTDSLVLSGYEGGYSVTNLTTIAALTMVANGYTGETASALLNTDQTLDGINGRAGEVLSVVLTDNPVWTPTLNFFTSESGTGSLRTQVAFQFRAEDGSSFAADLTDNPAPEMLLAGQTGETVTVSLFVSEAIGTFNGYSGEFATVTGLDLDQFYAVGTGESASANIAPTYNLPANGYEGAYVTVGLDLRPSEPLGIFRAYTGEGNGNTDSEPDLATRATVYLYPNPIRATQEMFCEFTATTSFDLLQTGCCPDFTQDTHEKIELNDMPEMDVRYSGDRTLVTADLSTRPRFTFDFHDGSFFRGIDPNYLGTFYAQTGENFNQSGSWATETLDIKLCIGNLIPNGGFVNVELISIYDENCPADIFTAGESMELVLNNTVQDSPRFHEGATMFADLVTSEIMLLRAWTGEYVRISNPEFQPRAWEGAYSGVSFWEPDWNGGDGAFAEARLTTEYDVGFLENGCLDNEFVPSDENGDPDWENFHRTPVEMEMYVHSIKARCW